MQPAIVDPMNLNQEDSDRLDLPDENEKIEEVNHKILDAIDTLNTNIYKFKEITYNDIVNHDKSHDASDMGAMMTYHALFLQAIAFWIGLMDSQSVPLPDYSSENHRRLLNRLTKKILEISALGVDARTQVYSLLVRFSTQHPFQLAPSIKNSAASR